MSGGEIEEVNVTQLVQAVAETRRYAFLIGAGTSRPEPAGIPTAGELIKQWQGECYERDDPGDDFEEWIADKEADIEESERYGFWFEQRYPTRGQRREFIRDLVEDAEPTPYHIILASLMNPGDDEEAYVPHTLTPNFDDLLFDAFYLYLEDKPQLIDHRAVAPEFRLTRDRSAIVKLHGDYLYDNLQNTFDETSVLEPGFSEVLDQTVSEYGLVVVGYGGNDRSIMDPLLEADLSEYGIYWCVRNSDHLAPKVDQLLRQPNTYLVEIRGFETLMARFAEFIDDIELPGRDELVKRAEARADMLDGALKTREEQATDEEEEEFLEKSTLEPRAHMAFEEGAYERVIETCNELLEIDPQSAFAFHLRGRAYAELEEYEQAKDDLRQAVEINPQDGDFHLDLAKLLRDLDSIDEARHHYERALEIRPQNAEAHYEYADFLQDQGAFKEATKHYDKATEINLGSANDHYNYAHLLREQGKLEEAQEHFKRTLMRDLRNAEPEYADAHYNYALLLQELGKPDQAYHHYERALKSDPQHADAHYNYAHLLREQDKLEEAQEHFERAIENDQEYIEAYLNRAEILIQQGAFQQARRVATNAHAQSESPANMARSLLLALIAAIVLDEEVEAEEAEYRDLCDQGFITTWSFDELNSWLDTADLPAEKQYRIEELIELLPTHNT